MKKITTKIITPLQNEKGMATIETIPLLIIFIILLGYAIGYFGAIHTGILNSIAARNYAFETFRHRANLTYFRDNSGANLNNYYVKSQVRFHSVATETLKPNKAEFRATERPISIGINSQQQVGRDVQTHNSRVPAIAAGVRNTDESVNPIWIKISYGICINAFCGEGS